MGGRIFSLCLVAGLISGVMLPSGTAETFDTRSTCWSKEDDQVPVWGVLEQFDIWLCNWIIQAKVNNPEPVGSCTSGSTCQYVFKEWIIADYNFGPGGTLWAGTLFKGATTHAHLSGSCDFDPNNEGCERYSEPAAHGHTSNQVCHEMVAEANFENAQTGVPAGHAETETADGFCGT